jgi:hypothetical protein
MHDPLQRAKPESQTKVHAFAVQVAVALATVVLHGIEVADRQPFESAVHVCSEVPLQVTPAAGQVLLQTHDAEPTAPEHAWPAGHATAARYPSQPCGVVPHVWSELGSAHWVCPIVHVATHVGVQVAPGAGLEQTSVPGHGPLEMTCGQPKASVPQVASELPWQAVPLLVQIEGWQTHMAVTPTSLQVWVGPHVVVGCHDVHPSRPARQVATLPARHSVA